nr:type II toxin-antitoxin system Phd/YefM family antitoxin [Thioalkalivibrio sp.]
MRTLSLAEAKTHLSSVLDQVQAGEEIVITRRGKRAARVVPERDFSAQDQAAILSELRTFLARQKPAKKAAVARVRALRDDARY